METEKETLADGTVLRALVKRYQESRSAEDRNEVISCLRESFVWIPCIAGTADTAGEKLSAAKARGTILTEDNIRLFPDILRKGDKRFFPAFSSSDQMDGEYDSRYRRVHVSFCEAMWIASGYKDIAGIVLDAFTQPFGIPRNMFGHIRMRAYRLPDED